MTTKKSRRAFVRTAMTTTGIVLAGGALLLRQQPHEPYRIWYENTLAGNLLAGERLAHPDLRRQNVPTEEEKIKLHKKLDEIMPTNAKIISETYYDERLVKPVHLSDALIKNYGQKISSHVQTLGTYLNWKEGMPQLEWHTLKPETVFDTQLRTSLPCYLVAEHMTSLRLEAKVMKEGQEGTGTSFEAGPRGGEILVPKKFTFYQLKYNQEGGLEILQEEPMIAILSLESALISYRAALSEILHYAVRRTKAEGVVKEYNEWQKENKGVPIPTNQFENISEEWFAREEGIVHALVDQFVEEHAQKEGFTLSDFAPPRYNEHHHRYVPQVRSFLKTSTPALLLKEYRTNARELFDRLQK